jgi:TolA-binding protein
VTASLRHRLVVTFMMGVVCSSSVRADYKDAYHEGYKLARQARQARDWEIVATKMEEALKENDREGEKVVLGSADTKTYLPFFYLGLARFHLGDCRGAHQNWIKSSAQKKLGMESREREWFNQFSPICDLTVSIEDAFKQTQSRLQSIDALAHDPDLGKIWNQDASFAPVLAKLRQRLDDARGSLRQARAAKVEQQQTLLTPVKEDAIDLSERTEKLLEAAGKRRDELVKLRTTNEKRLAEDRKPAPETTGAGNSTNTASRGGTPVETRPTDAKGVDPKPVGPGPLTPPTAPTHTAPTPPDALRAGLQQYLKGRYREARDGLQSQVVPAEWRAHAALLHAASAFSLYYAEGKKDRRLLDEASRAVQACAQANHDLQPPRSLFAPPFIEFFNRYAGPRQAARAAQP